ncbi:hypothetical protein C2S52_014593 [Perilla frutescens var. hirtella]|nr:hypothetical protein C2S52_014593 [Perilla frutescens var. hirtella]
MKEGLKIHRTSIENELRFAQSIFFLIFYADRTNRVPSPKTDSYADFFCSPQITSKWQKRCIIYFFSDHLLSPFITECRNCSRFEFELLLPSAPIYVSQASHFRFKNMNTQIVEIQPRELKFICEVKKQSSCAVHLLNATEQYVAFKVKTTSPKKYCVRPNIGIIKPKSTYDFTVTMQAQKSVPSDMQCKDKFLIQSTVVPYGTSEEEITSSMFARESQKYIEETKLKVVLTSAPSSPEKPPASVVSKQEPSYEFLMPKEPYSHDLLPVNGVNKQEPHYETSVPKDTVQNGIENSLPPDMGEILLPLHHDQVIDHRIQTTKPVEAVKVVKHMEESTSLKVTDMEKSIPTEVKEFYVDRDDKSKQIKDLEEVKLKLMEEIEDLRSKIGAMDLKLVEAEYTIEKLKVEKSNTIREKEALKQDLATSRPMSGARKIQVGFPPLFVCMVALISLMIGIYYRA